ncbi:MAG TPA: hypothetical protein VK601_30065, partial [Kofleriaceae bacterium]|nr:hypothetical protein [Kofleriaceae bacterium]
MTMRWLGALALISACGGTQAPPPDGGAVSLVLDIPNGMLDPSGYTTVQIVLHEPTRDVTRTASVDASGHFDLDRIDPSESVSIEAWLRNDSGAAVGYGRTSVTAALAGGAAITVPVRRPIAYFAGTVNRDAGGDPTSGPMHWSEVPATYLDLSTGATLDGTTLVGSNAVLMIAAGPSLYVVTQAVMDPNGLLTGPAKLTPISSADHAVGTALSGTTMTGAVLDGAGADDGAQVVVATTAQLYAIDTASGAARSVGDGSFARVALLTGETGELAAVAIKGRGATTGACATTAELWWAPLTGAAAGPGHMVATGGFSDLATDRGHAYYVDACKGELGEVTATAATSLGAIPGTGTAAGPGAGKPTALAVSNGQAYVGVETPSTGGMAPATASLLVTSIGGTGGAMRTLWTEGARQVLDVKSQPDVQRQLSASSVVIQHLEVGAGGDYIALTTNAHFHGAAIPGLFPEMTIDTEELRVFAAASGGVIQRYRSWCDGVLINDGSELSGWECSAATGQSAAFDDIYEHHVG